MISVSQSSQLEQCLLVEDDWVHDEIIPTIIYYLNLLGFKPKIIIRKYLQLARGNILDLCGDLQFDTVSAEDFEVETKNFWPNILEIFGAVRLIITNTTTETEIEALRRADIPTISIWHRPPTSHDRDMSYVSKASNYNLMLGRHVLTSYWSRLEAAGSSASSLREKSSYFTPCYLGPLSDKLPTPGHADIVRVGVPGGIEFSRRDYGSLLDFVVNLESLEQQRLKFVIPGGGPEKRRLQDAVAQNHLSDNFEFIEGSSGFPDIVRHDQYFAALKTCHFCLPLQNSLDIGYHTNKISSAIATGIGLRKPFIVDHRTAIVYDCEGIIYENDIISESLNRALSISDYEYQEIYNMVDKLYDREIRRGLDSWRRALTYLGLV